MAVSDRKSRIIFKLILACCPLFFFGCGRRQDSPPGKPPEGAIRLSPSELFRGDLKRIEPHLGLTSGCFKVEFAGTDQWVRRRIEVWQNGKARHLSTSGQPLKGPSEISISVREMDDPRGEVKKYLVTEAIEANTSGAGRQVVDAPQFKNMHSTTYAGHDAVTIRQGDPPVAVWALVAYETQAGGPLPGPKGSVEEAAKNADWALVLKVAPGHEGGDE